MSLLCVIVNQDKSYIILTITTYVSLVLPQPLPQLSYLRILVLYHLFHVCHLSELIYLLLQLLFGVHCLLPEVLAYLYGRIPLLHDLIQPPLEVIYLLLCALHGLISSLNHLRPPGQRHCQLFLQLLQHLLHSLVLCLEFLRFI